jgi:hypothetical protein
MTISIFLCFFFFLPMRAAASPVGTFEAQADEFVAEMRGIGVTITTTTEVFNA